MPAPRDARYPRRHQPTHNSPSPSLSRTRRTTESHSAATITDTTISKFMIDLVESKSRRILKTSHYSHNYTKFSVVPVGQPSRTAPSSRGRRQIKKAGIPKGPGQHTPRRISTHSISFVFRNEIKKTRPKAGGPNQPSHRPLTGQPESHPSPHFGRALRSSHSTNFLIAWVMPGIREDNEACKVR